MIYYCQKSEFMRKKLKDIKILHIGNIANNAYNISKWLREKGIQNDVICYDYYHIMGDPEWEGDYGNDFAPDWSKVNLGSFKRPDWFIQGPLEKIAQNHFEIETSIYSNQTIYPCSTYSSLGIIILAKIARLISSFQSFVYKFYLGRFYRPKKFRLQVLFLGGKILGIGTNLLIRYFVWAQKELVPRQIKVAEEKNEYDYYRQLVKDFREVFPERPDKLTMRDIYPYLYRARIFQQIFKKYDLVQCYATDPIYAMLANKHPYVAYEHGTIRDIPFEKSSLGRLTALAYRKADLVFVTNADNLLATKKLGLKNFVGIPHPINDFWHLRYRKNKDKNIIKTLFCPLRHDWKIKGVNFYINALPKIAQVLKIPFKIVFIEWGMETTKSKKLIEKLEVEKYVQWIKPLPRHLLADWMEKADIICDQIALPHMGGTAPEGMLAGKPVLMSYKPESTDWMHPRAPIISVFNTADILKEIKSLLTNPQKAKKIGKEGQKWFYKHYSKKVVLNRLIKSYDRLLKKDKKWPKTLRKD